MNKTVNINISGMVFHIEEDAYDALKKYMHEIKMYFSRTADDAEVVTDIENRIAEMFTETLKAGHREVIVLKDVEGVITQIGKVSDFEEAAPEEPAPQPEIPRRLFRDPDDKKLGGVCAGISHYFDWDPVWLRIITAVLTILTSGLAALIYVILWMVMPLANTLAEKMAMKGERFHLSNFKRSFDEEISGVKDTFNNLKNEVSNPNNVNSFKNFVNEVIDLIARIVRGIGKVLLPVLAIILTIIGILWLIGTFTGIATFIGLSDSELTRYFPFNIMEPQYKSGFTLSVAGLIGIPAIALILLGVRVLFKRKVINGPVTLGMLAVWLVALGFTIYYSTVTASGFRQGASVRRTTELQPASANTWYLELDEYSSSGGGVAERSGISGGADTIASGRSSGLPFSAGRNYRAWSEYERDFDDWDEDIYEVELRIEQSSTGTAALVEVFNSRGRDFNDAVDHTGDIRYEFSQADSLLNFDRYFSLPENALWRGQRVDLTLQLPLNSTLVIDRKLRRILENHEVYAYDFDDVREWALTKEGLRPVGELPQDTASTSIK